MANDFSGDANCVALYRFESGALTTDSKGTNTLTNQNTVSENTVTYKEGACAADFAEASSELFFITDANLDAGFPFKSGDTNKKISVCFWIQIDTFPGGIANDFLVSKFNVVGNKRNFAIGLYSTATLRFGIGYNAGASAEWVSYGSGLVTGRWYHVGVTFQDSDKSWKIRVWDDTALTVNETTGTTTNNINVEDSAFSIGGGYDDNAYYHDGRQDETVVFDDILTSGEIDQIRLGIYGTVKPWYAYAQM